MADFRLNVSAETREAERKLREVDKAADKATRSRSLKVDTSFIGNAAQNFKELQTNLKEAANNVQTFYRVSKAIPGVGDRVREFEEIAKNTAQASKESFLLGAALKENAKAGAILSNSLELAAGAGSRLITTLAKIGFATFALKEAVGVLQSAWTGFFNNTVGREIKLRETILKTQTTLASTNKVFRGGTEITDPYQKIVALTGEVGKRIDSIRERSIALAGVTSNDVIEVFGIVASQVGQIGGGLKEAEDLAINFAAALGTFGIPLYQARQEVGSILRGDITMDSYLAKALGITNEDIARAKTEAGGVVKFLEDRLAAAVAGQRIAAEGFSGVVSNIADLGELIGQNFGRGLLDPLLAGLSNVFETLFRIRKQIFDIAEGAGRAIGRSAQLIVGLTAGRTGIGAGDPNAAASAASAVARRAFTEVEKIAQRTVGAIARTIEALRPTALILVDAFRNIAEAFISIKVGTFEALASAISNIATVVGTIAPALATVFNLYARFLNTDAVRYFSEVAAVLGLLKRVGLDAATQLVLFGRFIVGLVVPAIGALGTALAGLVGAIAAIIIAVGKLVLTFAGLATALVTPAAAIPALAAGLKALAVELTSVGNQATGAGAKLSGLATGFRGLGAAAKAAGVSILASLGWIAAIQIGIAVLVDAFGRFQRAQEDQRASERANLALTRLETTYKDISEEADEATKRAKEFEETIVDAEYNKAINKLEELRNKIEEIKDLSSDSNLDFGDYTRRIAQLFNPANFDAFTQQRKGEMFADAVLRLRREQEKEAAAEAERLSKEVNKKSAAENIRLEAQNRKNLEREIGDIRRQQEDQLFQLRQQRAQKEVEIFRLAGELRIFQMEQANKKLIEGEEGASAAALEALNNYLSVRERGELDIEASKKEIAIEAANLEKQISDYRLENEKKIAEIRKRAGDYEKKVADYQRQLQTLPMQGPPTPGSYAGRTGGGQNDPSRGRSSGPHLHAQTSGMTEAELKDFINKALIFPDGFRASAYGYNRGFAGHGYPGIDIATPQGTPFNLAPGYSARDLGIRGALGRGMEIVGPDGRRATLGHLVSASNQGAGPIPTAPDAPTFDDIGAPAVEKYAAAVRNLAGALERARALQEALTDAKTEAAFKEIAKAAFPQVNVEQYRDQITEADQALKILASTAGEAYDPERLRIAIDYQTKLKVQEDELAEIRKRANEALNPEERRRLEAEIAERQKKFNEGLLLEKQLREQLLPLIRAQAAIERLRETQKDLRAQVTSTQIQNLGTAAQAFGNPEDYRRNRLIEAEIAIAQRRNELESQGNLNQEQVNAELQRTALVQYETAESLAKLDEELAKFQQTIALLREAAKTISDGYKNFLKSVLTGGNIQEALTSMLEGIADRFLTLALDAAFKPVEDALFRTFSDFFGVEDPMAELQRANTLSTDTNTLAINALTTAVTGLNQSITRIPVEPKGDQPPPPPAPEPPAPPAEEAADAMNRQAEAAEKVAKSSKAAGDANADFNKSLGQVAVAAAGLGGVIAGIQSISKGGVYNILMGIAGIFGSIGSITSIFRAEGGPVSARRPYIVGERGPELFVPSANGTVIPDDRTRALLASRTALNTVSGTTYSGDPLDASRSALATTSAVARERMTERILTATLAAPSAPMDIRYEANVINNVEYVTSDQFQRGMSDAAERGRAMTLSALKNSVKARRQVGI